MAFKAGSGSHCRIPKVRPVSSAKRLSSALEYGVRAFVGITTEGAMLLRTSTTFKIVIWSSPGLSERKLKVHLQHRLPEGKLLALCLLAFSFQTNFTPWPKREVSQLVL